MANIGGIEIKDLSLGGKRPNAVWFGGYLVWGAEPGPTPPGPTPGVDAVCFTAGSNGATVKLATIGTPDWDVYLETSTDGETWTALSYNTTKTLANVGDKLYMRASQDQTDINGGDTTYSNFYNIQTTGVVDVSGPIVRLLSKTNSTPTMGKHAFGALFDSQTIRDASGLVFPDYVSELCYANMFWGCTNLTAAPALPALTGATNCYMYMFAGCTSLTTAARMYLTTWPVKNMRKSSCCDNMYNGCTSLNSVEVDFTEWPYYGSGMYMGCQDWLKDVASSGTFTCPSTLDYGGTVTTYPASWTRVNK